MIIYYRDGQSWEQFITNSMIKSSNKAEYQTSSNQKKNIATEPYTVKRLSHGSSVLNPYFDSGKKELNEKQKKQQLSFNAFATKDALKRFIYKQDKKIKISGIEDIPELIHAIFSMGNDRLLKSDFIFKLGAFYKLPMALQIHSNFIKKLSENDLFKKLNIPEFQQERRYYLNQACKHFTNELYEESLENLIQTEQYEKYDPFVLLTMGILHLYSLPLLNVKKALELFVKSAKYYKAENNTEKRAESFFHASIASYILKKDEKAIQYAEQTLKLLPTFNEAAYLLSRFKATIGDDSCMEIIKSLIEKDPLYGLKAHVDDAFLKLSDKLYQITKSLRNSVKSECDKTHLAMIADRHLEKYQKRNPDNFKKWKSLFNEGNQIYQNNSYLDYLDACPILIESDIFFQSCKHGKPTKKGKPGSSPLNQYEKQQNKFISIDKGHIKKDTDIAEKEIFDLLNETKALVNHNTDFQYLTRVTQAQASEKIAHLLDNPLACIDIATLSSNGSGVHTIAFSSCGKQLASGSEDGTIRIWDLKTNECVSILNNHKKAVNCLCFSSDGRLLASASWDNTIKLWDLNKFKEIITLQGHEDSVETIDFTMDSYILGSGSNDQTVKLWDLKKNKVIHTFDNFSDTIRCVNFSPDGLQIAAGSWDLIHIWDVSSKKLVHSFKGHTKNYISSISISPDGLTIAAGSHDKTVRLWDMASKKQSLKLQGHLRRINCVAFSPDNMTLASGSHDKQVKLWNVKTGKEICGLDSHKDIVSSVVFSPDGMMLASASHDGYIRLWQIHYKIMPKDALVEIIERNIADARRRRQAQWRAEMRCEICGDRLGFLDILKGRVHCQKHESTD